MKSIRPAGLLAVLATLAAVVALRSGDGFLVRIGMGEVSARFHPVANGSIGANSGKQAEAPLHPGDELPVKRPSSSGGPESCRSSAAPGLAVTAAPPPLISEKHTRPSARVMQRKALSARDTSPGIDPHETMPSSGLDSPGFPAVSHTAREYGPYHLPQPAVWADPGDAIPADPERDQAIQQEAELLLEQISKFNFPTDSDEYRNQWDNAVANSDQFFRQRYGGWSWMAHHVQAHHLAAARQLNAP